MSLKKPNSAGGSEWISPLELRKKQGVNETNVLVSTINNTLSGAIIGRGYSGAVTFWDSISSITSSSRYQYVDGVGVALTGTMSATRNYVDTSATAPLVAHELASKQYVDNAIAFASGSTWYYLEQASDIATYFSLSSSPTNTTEDIDTAVVNSGTALIESYASSGLGIVFIPAGKWSFGTYAKVSSTVAGDSYIIVETYIRSGATETLLGSCTSDVLSDTVQLHDIDVIYPYVSLAASDRLVVKVIAKTTATVNRTVSFYHNGITHYSHIHTPVQLVSGGGGIGQSGYSGYSGIGQSGFSGYSGIGTSGYSGYSGIGTSGFSGYSGVGTSGYSGYSGTSGTSGVGSSGYSGYSGASGSSAAANGTLSGIAVFDTTTSISSYESLIYNKSTGTLKGGIGSIATGAGSVSLGTSTSAQGIASFASGYSTTALGNYSVAMGGYNSSTGANSFAIGLSNQANAAYSAAFGYRSKSIFPSQISQSCGYFAENGDAQASSFVVRTQTQNDTSWYIASYDGSAMGFTFPMSPNTSYVVEAFVVARGGTGQGNVGTWQVVAMATRDATLGSAYVGGMTKFMIHNPHNYDCNLVANGTYGSFDLECTGAAGQTVSFVAHIRITEVKV